VRGTSRERIAMEDFPGEPLAALFGLNEQARANFAAVLRGDFDWSESLRYGNKERNFWVSASRRKMFTHAMVHSLRHWAQLASALREAGFKQDWQHDFIFTQVME